MVSYSALIGWSFVWISVLIRQVLWFLYVFIRIRYVGVYLIGCATRVYMLSCDVCNNSDTDESNIKKHVQSFVINATLWCQCDVYNNMVSMRCMQQYGHGRKQ